MSNITQYGYSNDEKRETVEFIIEERRWARNSDELAQCAIYDRLRSIASDYRARDRLKINDTIKKLERALEYAEAKKRKHQLLGYDAGNLQEIGKLVIGSWPVLRQALEEFENHDD